jgi:hypothetical protein
MLLLLQGKSGTELGELPSLAILTGTCCKVWRTLKSSSSFDRIPNGTFKIRYNTWKFANFWPNLKLNNPGTQSVNIHAHSYIHTAKLTVGASECFTGHVVTHLARVTSPAIVRHPPFVLKPTQSREEWSGWLLTADPNWLTTSILKWWGNKSHWSTFPDFG